MCPPTDEEELDPAWSRIEGSAAWVAQGGGGSAAWGAEAGQGSAPEAAPGAGAGGAWAAPPEERDGRSSAGPGHPLPRYSAQGEIGRGGMGRVDATFDGLLGRSVARKSLREGGQADRLVREARITARLEHPGIVPVYDAGGDEAGRPWYTMRLVRGRSLSRAVAEAGGPADRRLLLRHVLAACEAVAYAHRQGVVHRDLKPANIMIGEFGETQVVDWGLARELREVDDAERAPPADPDGAPPVAAAPDRAATIAGAVLGTPRYMSPEQARGEPADARSDVYGLGTALWEVLSGAPFDRGTLSISGEAGVGGRAEFSRPEVAVGSRELSAIARRALAPDPIDRYPDALALARDLERYLDGGRVAAHEYSSAELLARLVRAWRGPLLVAAVATCIVLLVGVAGWIRTDQQRTRAVQAESTAQAALRRSDASLVRALLAQARAALRVHAGSETAFLAASVLAIDDVPEARGLLGAGLLAAPTRRIDRAAGGSCARRLPVPRSPDWICIDAAGISRQSAVGVARREAGGAVAAQSAPSPPPAPPSWWTVPGQVGEAAASLDGSLVAAWVDGALRLLDGATGRDVDNALAEAVREREIGPWPLRFTADGRALWFWAQPGPVLRVDIATGRATSVAPCGAPGATALVTARDGGFVVGCPGGGLALTAPDGSVRIEGPFGRDIGDAIVLATSPDGSLVAGGTPEGQLAVVDVQAARTLFVARGLGGAVGAIAFDERGERLAVQTDRGGVEVRAAREDALLLQLPREASGEPVFVGDHLRVLGERNTLWDLGGERAVALRRAGSGVASLAFSPDGARLLSTHGDGEVQVAATGGPGLLVLPGQGRVAKDAAFTPDGRQILSVSMDSGAVRVRDARTGAAGPPLRWPEDLPLRRVDALADGRVVAVPFVDRGPLVWRGLGAVEPRSLGLGAVLDAHASPSGHAIGFAGPAGLHLLRSGEDEPVHVGAGPCYAVAVGGTSGAEILAAWGEAGGVAGPIGALRPLDPLPEAALDAAISPDGRWVAAGGASGTVWLLSAETGAVLAVLRGHEGRVAALDFSPDGRWLATGGWDSLTRLWDVTAMTAPSPPLPEQLGARWGIELDAALEEDDR